MREKILAMLSDGEEISGEAISRALQISRAAVAKHINVLRNEGYYIEAAPRRGYRLLRAPDLLTQAEILRWLPQGSPWRIDTHHELETTMKEARRLAEAGADEYHVVIAEQQTAAVGRLGRPWYAPGGCGLWMTMLLRPPLPPAEAQLLTLTTAVAITEALRGLGFPAGIKWPNDLLSLEPAYPRRKLCGIRTEMRADMDRVAWLIVGVGLNINNVSFPPALSEVACSLRQLNHGEPLRRGRVAAAILARMQENYRLLCASGFADIRRAWLALAVGLNEPVELRMSDSVTRGVAIGLDERGYLLLRPADGGPTRRILAGDMQLMV